MDNPQFGGLKSPSFQGATFGASSPPLTFKGLVEGIFPFGVFLPFLVVAFLRFSSFLSVPQKGAGKRGRPLTLFFGHFLVTFFSFSDTFW